MATDIDKSAVDRSINMLDGQRWGQYGFEEVNKIYMMPEADWDSIKNDPLQIIKVLKYFLRHHYDKQLPRILGLERYYKGDNNIHYANFNKSSNRADNRVTSGFPKFITNIDVGYQVGNPIKFQYNDDDGEDTDLEDVVTDFNSRNDESYHEKVMKKNLSVTGRAYELEYVRSGTNEVAIKPIDPANAFVVYDTTVEQHSLFAVRYYLVNYMDKPKYYVEVYTDDTIYYFTDGHNPATDLKFDHKEEHYFFDVPLTEYLNNDERIGKWELELDKIDAIDKSLSEMANSQEDYSNAIMWINGDFDITGEDGKQNEHPAIDRKAGVIWMKPSVINNLSGTGSTVIPASIGYVTKDVNVGDWKIYVDLLSAQIHKDTNTLDTTDSNFSGQQTGEAMSFKLLGSDQERSIQESLYTRGVMRRLRLLSNYLEVTGVISHAENVENFHIIYTPNLPKNDEKIVANSVSLVNTGKISNETFWDSIEPITGVNAETEKNRVDDEQNDELEKDPLQKVFTPAENETGQSIDDKEAASDDSKTK